MEDASLVVGPGVTARGTALPVVPGASLLTMRRLNVARINLRIASCVERGCVNHSICLRVYHF